MVFPENKSEKLKNELFENPIAEYRGLPFWSWNCSLNTDMVDEQLEIFKEMGFGGVVIHPRDGLDSEYLGDEFMDVIKHTVTRCKEMGLICWLYDDDRFPSGAADGLGLYLQDLQAPGRLAGGTGSEHPNTASFTHVIRRRGEA